MYKCGIADTNTSTITDQFHYLEPSYFGYESIKDAYAAYDYTLILTDSGKFYIAGDISVFYDNGDTPVPGFNLLPTPPEMDMNSIQHVLTLQRCIVCIDSQMNFWCIGSNSHGPMGSNSLTKGRILSKFTKLRPFDELGQRMNTNFTIRHLTHVAHGSYHIIIICNRRDVYTVGFNGCGELCLGTVTSMNTYQKVNIEFQSDVRMVNVGLNHNLILLEDNTIFVSGYNAFGQLGLNNFTNATVLTQLKDNLVVTNIIRDISAGYHHSVYLTMNYRVFACGWNKDYSILTRHDNENYCSLIEITTCINKVCSDPFNIVCGGYTVYVVSAERVFVCGRLTDSDAFEPQGSLTFVGYMRSVRKVDSGYSHALIHCKSQASDVKKLVCTLLKRSRDFKLSDVIIQFQQQPQQK
jgi:alpha-tubulin suppressor-like RCC1 family protein